MQVGVKFRSLEDARPLVIVQCSSPLTLTPTSKELRCPGEVSQCSPRAASASPQETQSARAPTGGASELALHAAPPTPAPLRARILSRAQAVGRGLQVVGGRYRVGQAS